MAKPVATPKDERTVYEKARDALGVMLLEKTLRAGGTIEIPSLGIKVSSAGDRRNRNRFQARRTRNKASLRCVQRNKSRRTQRAIK